MKDKRPLLSICIPTFNRAEYLERSLERYVSDTAFCDEIEIVISDNASTDNTQLVGEKYTSLYTNIKYYRNKINVNDENFYLALDRASGEYVKLMNDSLLLEKAALGYLLNTVQAHMNDRTPLFFINMPGFNHTPSDEIECNNFGEFVKYLSFVVTAISCFGAWRENWNNVKDRQKYASLKLCQDDWCYQIVEKQGHCILLTKPYFTTMNIGIRAGYNWFEVHVKNYYTILQPYIDKGLVSDADLSIEKRTYLKGLKPQIVMNYIYNIIPTWQFDMSGTSQILWKYFKKEPFFYLLMGTLPLWGSLMVLRYFIMKIVKRHLL